MQQYLPFTVLKPLDIIFILKPLSVATVPTVYGIETLGRYINTNSFFIVATVPTVYGIETI